MQNNLRILYLLILALVLFPGCTKDNDENLPGAANNLSLGISSNDLLSQEKYTSMKVEITYVTGYEPSATTLTNIKTFLEEHTNKPGGISLEKRAINSMGGGPYTISEVKEIEDESRSAFNSGKEIAVFILFIDGKSATQEDGNKLILGTAYKNTSMVIYEKTIKELSETSGLSKSDIESTTIMHEFGHLFGLVDNGSPAQSDHEDIENKSHCNVENCLMVASVEFGTGTIKMLQKRTEPIQFDDSCRLDLRANGGR